MNRKLYFVILIFLPIISFCQSLSHSVIASDGGFYSFSNGSLSQTFGEIITQTTAVSTVRLTQGFQQTKPPFEIGILEEIFGKLQISFYPNPASKSVFIELKYNTHLKFQLTLIDMDGKLLLKKTISSDLNEVNIESLMSGMYVVKITEPETGYSNFYKFQKIF
jgi:hypothetical protein